MPSFDALALRFPPCTAPLPLALRATSPESYNVSRNPCSINTSKSVSKQMTLSSFRINTSEKPHGGWVVIVNSFHPERFLLQVTRCRRSPVCPQRPPQAGDSIRPEDSWPLPFHGSRITAQASRISLHPYFVTSLLPSPRNTSVTDFLTSLLRYLFTSFSAQHGARTTGHGVTRLPRLPRASRGANAGGHFLLLIEP